MSRPLHERPRSFYPRFERKGGDPTVTHYCPGCGHGNVHKYVAEAIDRMGLADRVIFVNPVGCSVFAHYYLDVGHVQAAHGRAPAVATAIKRARPDSIVIAYQGDGDLAAIGANEILQAAGRGENITVIFINNALYGMTGGQLAPTSLIGQVTSTTPYGRDASQEGYPMRVCELLGALEAPVYLERVALGDARNDLKARRAIQRAIRNQVEGRGFSLVEVMSPCPTGWKMTPPDAARFVLETMTGTFPVGVVREPVPGAVPRPPTGRRSDVAAAAIPEILGLRPPEGEAALPAWTIPEGWAPREGGPLVEPRYEDPRIKVAGFGGQGVLFLGALLAEAGMLAGRAVSWLPSYGPEMRGGTAHCHVILSRTQVDSPLVSRASVLFAFNRPSLDRFIGEVVPGGLVVYDASLIGAPPPLPGVEVIAVPATERAERVGARRAANLVALGAYLERTRLLPPAAIEAALRGHGFKAESIAMNMKALEAGREAGRLR